jgi:hypothetical protein
MTKPRRAFRSPSSTPDSADPRDYELEVATVAELGLDARFVRCPGGNTRCRLFAVVGENGEEGSDGGTMLCVGRGDGGFREQALADALASYFQRVEETIDQGAA